MTSAQAVDADRAIQIPENLPPMLRQYLDFKARYQDCLLLFQVGDFYEAFFEDAIVLARTLNVTLTSRDKSSPNPIPMAGVPIAVIDSYLTRLVAAQLSVALVSQSGDASTGSSVTRELDRIITPGINISSRENNNSSTGCLATVVLDKPQNSNIAEFVVAYSSVSSGCIAVRSFQGLEALINFLDSMSPAELVMPVLIDNQKIDRRLTWVRRLENKLNGTVIKYRSLHMLPVAVESERLTSITGYSALAPLTKKAVRLLVQFVDEVTVKADFPFVQIVSDLDQSGLAMDAMTRRNLELLKNSKDGGENGSLFGSINRTVSVSGARLLRDWLAQPLIDLEMISCRLDVVEQFVNAATTRKNLEKTLVAISDLERCAVRTELGLVLPYELAALRDTLFKARAVQQLLQQQKQTPVLLQKALQDLEIPDDLLKILSASLADQVPSSDYRGKVFKAGYDRELDRLRNLKDSAADWMMQFEAREREGSGIGSLRVRHNNVHGYFIEITKANLARTPEHYVRKQTTVNAERFIVPELKEMEQEIYLADQRLEQRESELLRDLIAELTRYSGVLRRVHNTLALLDVLNSLAILAVEFSLVRPELDNSRTLAIVDGRHPVLMQVLGARLIANSLELNAQQFCALITGANMGGKSTYLRQAALIVIMGQIGGFVPANSACFGIVDKIFARLGASDDLLEGESTFMVEMREAANILSNATNKSLVLIDEIGRGTATADGLAIARAILEWIINRIQCRTLFATHFHDLTVLDQQYREMKNLSVATIEAGESFLFTHEIKQGAADKSYGLEVAKLAGLPRALLNRAAKILEQIIANDQLELGSRQLTLFGDGAQGLFHEDNSIGGDQLNIQGSGAASERKIIGIEQYSALEELRALDLNQLRPIDALMELNRLQEKIGS